MFKRYLVILATVMASASFVLGQTSWPLSVTIPRVVKAQNFGSAPLVSNFYSVYQADLDSLRSDLRITINVTAVNDSNDVNLNITYQDIKSNQSVSETRANYRMGGELQLPVDTLRFSAYKVRPKIVRVLFYTTKRQSTDMRFVANIVPSDTIRVRVTNDSLATY